jgi:hypothetical protein
MLDQYHAVLVEAAARDEVGLCRGNQHHRGVFERRQRTAPAHELVAGHVGQAKDQQNHRWCGAVQQREPFLARSGDVHPNFSIAERFGKHVQERLIVVYDQDVR